MAGKINLNIGLFRARITDMSKIQVDRAKYLQKRGKSVIKISKKKVESIFFIGNLLSV